MKRDHVASILCFGRKVHVLPIFNLKQAVAGVLSCWYSAVMDGPGLRIKTFGLLTKFLRSTCWQSN